MGVFNVKNTYRSGLRTVVEDLSAKYRLLVLSGDNDQEKKALEKVFPPSASMYFEQRPDEKLRKVKQLQQEGAFVMMFGDGLNDAGALKQSEVGVAITEDVSSFNPACDAIMDANAFSKLSKLLELVLVGKRVVKASMGISLFYNLGGITFAVMGLLTPLVAAILMPLSSISVVVFTTSMIRMYAKQKRL